MVYCIRAVLNLSNIENNIINFMKNLGGSEFFSISARSFFKFFIILDSPNIVYPEASSYLAISSSISSLKIPLHKNL